MLEAVKAYTTIWPCSITVEKGYARIIFYVLQQIIDMQKSLTKNSFFYFIYNVLNMVFPFLTSMYVARILPPTMIGEVAYAQNIVSYFTILAFLGLPTYGLREISKARYHYEELCKLFSELFIINFISTVVFSSIYYGMILLVPDFQNNLLLYSVVGITVILNMLNIGWLFEGLEEFRYVSIRNAVFKFIMFALLLLIVRGPDDMIPYVLITILGVAGNNAVNVFFSRKFIKFQWHGLHFARHMKSIFMLVMVNLAIEIYSLVGTSMLGALATKESVAFYTYADKTNSILKQITNTITMVLVPRIALYYGEGKMEDFNILLTKALKILVLLAVPIIVGMQFTADFLFPSLFGAAYIQAAAVERILCLGLLIAPIGYLLGSRVLLVSGKENKMALCVSAGAVTNVIGNYVLIRSFNEIGAAMACLIGELVVASLYINYGRTVFSLYPLRKNVLNVFLAGAVMALYLFTCNLILSYGWPRLILQVLGSAFVYAVALWVLKDSVFCEFGNRYILSVFKKA